LIGTPRRSIIVRIIMKSLLLLLVLCLALANGSLARDMDRSLVYHRTSVPEGWSRLSLANAQDRITFTLVLKSENDELLESLFHSVSNPKHEKYGMFVTHDEIVELVRLNPTDRAVLFQQLAKHQITDQDVVLDGGDSLRIRTSVQKASNFFETQFYVFEHQKTGLKAIRQWNEFSIPSEIEHCVSLVLDVHTFPTIEQRLKMRGSEIASRSGSSPTNNGKAEFRHHSHLRATIDRGHLWNTDAK